MRTYLLVAGVGGTLHHLRKRYGRLDLIHLLVRHRHDFLQADQSGFRHQQAVVLVHTAAVVLRHVVGTQFGWQQEVEPRGLVDALTADEHQYLVVHAVAQEARYHRYQPLLQAVEEGLLHLGRSVGQRYRIGQQPDVVRIAFLPLRESVAVGLERMEYGYELRAEHQAEVGKAHRLLLLVDAAPQCAFIAVSHRAEALFPVLPANFGHPGDFVPAEVRKFR